MIDVEKFLISLRNHKAPDGRLDPIHLADTVQEEIKIIQAAVKNSRREWVGLTDEEYAELWGKKPDLLNFFRKIEAKLREKNHG